MLRIGDGDGEGKWSMMMTIEGEKGRGEGEDEESSEEMLCWGEEGVKMHLRLRAKRKRL